VVFSWWRKPINSTSSRSSKKRRSADRPKARRTQPRLEQLEDRRLLTIMLGTNFAGLSDGDNLFGGGIDPPDTDIAVGPKRLLPTRNAVIRIYDETANSLL